jgi:hypothetical protein
MPSIAFAHRSLLLTAHPCFLAQETILPHYEPGVETKFNAMRTRAVICLDGDGTLYHKPEQGDPLANKLSNSEAFKPIISYLKAGGILALLSGACAAFCFLLDSANVVRSHDFQLHTLPGNDPQRTVVRFLENVALFEPMDEWDMHMRNRLLPGVIIAGAGVWCMDSLIREVSMQPIALSHDFTHPALILRRSQCPILSPYPPPLSMPHPPLILRRSQCPILSQGATR